MSRKPEWSEVEPALGLALEMNESERAGFLASLPEDVRAEVISLLDADQRAVQFLDSGTQRGIAVGAMLGAYRIEKEIGAGGMGVVYLGTDTKLNRPVAVKFLPADVADPATRKRFQREALMASSLNHPHILTVHDAGEYEGWPYLVTEFVDGGTLREWARTQKRNWREIVGLMAGVADGLAAAHAANILHRDIKPGNILVARNGYAKVADFGLAKIEENGSQDAATRKLDSEISKPGMIVGTIPYMSPEQAAGLHTDGRSDIFSFGVVLYELLMGKRPFQGSTDLDTLKAIRHGTVPPLSQDVPLALRMIVEKALENDPANRYQTARDLVVDLRRLTRQSGEISAPASKSAVAAGAKYATRRIVWISAAGCAAAALLGTAIWRFERPAVQPPGQVLQFDIQAPPGSIFAPPITRQSFAISPDGKRLAFTATGMNGTNIWLRELSSLDIRPIAGTEGAWAVLWAPDSKSVYFSVKDSLKQVNVETGSWRTVKEHSDLAQSGTWLKNGNLLLYFSMGDLLEFHPKDGSTDKLAIGERARWPQALPSGNRIMYVEYDPQADTSHEFVVDYHTDSTKPTMLMETDSRAEYAPPSRIGEPGHLVFIRGGSLLAQPFDADRLQLAGEPFPIAQNVPFYGPVLSANFSVSPNGVLVYQSGFPNAELKWYDRGGKELSATGKGMAQWGQVRSSRDGKQVAATIWTPENGGTGIWILDANGHESSRMTFPPVVDRRPAWSPDGRRIAVGRSPKVGSPKLAIVDLVTGKAEYFLEGKPNRHSGLPTDWSKDGRFIALDDGLGQEVRKVQVADLVAKRYVPLLDSPFPQWGLSFSPDGQQIAFLSLESGRPEVYVQGFSAAPEPHLTGPRRHASTAGAWLVRWRGDGRELYFVGLDNVLYAAPVNAVAAVGEAKALFQIPGTPQYGGARDFQFDVSADGQRFLMPNTGSVAPLPLTVIENWQEKFRR